MGVFFNVRDLEVRKAHFDVTISEGEIDYVEGLRQSGPLEAEGTAELLGNTLGEIRVRGRLKVTMEAECDRCLETAGSRSSRISICFTGRCPRSRAGEEVAIDEGETEIGFYEGGGFELKEILREYILLALPMQRVCREDCKGICPVCGTEPERDAPATATSASRRRPLGRAEEDLQTITMKDWRYAKSKTTTLQASAPPPAAPTTP